jgi:hypothetical protein
MDTTPFVRLQVGAANGIGADPFSADLIFLSTVNGGVWRTTDGTSASPTWQPLTDQFPSLSMGACAISPLDSIGAMRTASTPLSQTVVYAGFLRNSSGFGDGGPLSGILKSTDGGATWTQETALSGNNITKILPTSISTPTGQVVLAAAAGIGIFRSTDGGATFGPGPTPTPVLAGNVTSLVADPSNPMQFYAAISGVYNGSTLVTPGQGIFLSTDGGQTWNPDNGNISTSSPGLIAGSPFIEVTSPGGMAVFTILVPVGSSTMNPPQVFRSPDQGSTWTPMDPFPDPSHQAGFAADPDHPNVVFAAGVPGGGPAKLGDGGAIYRGDLLAVGTPQWQLISFGGATNTAPHVDGRDMVFSNGTLLDTNDGGIYRLVNPNGDSSPAPPRAWAPLVGNMQTTEFYSVAYDSLNNIIFGGSQDNGTDRQQPNTDPRFPFHWVETIGGDGATVAVDNDQTAHPGTTIKYTTLNNLGSFTRWTVDNTGTETSTPVLMRINGSTTGAAPLNTLAGVEAGLAGGSTIQFVQPFVLNAVDPSRMLLGTNFLYESFNRGDNFFSLGGLQDLNNDGIDNDGDGVADEGNEFRPTNPIGTVDTDGITAHPMAYGGRLGGAANPDIVYVGSAGGTVNGVFGRLFLRKVLSNPANPTLADFSALTNYPGAAPRGIVLDPDNWQRGYVLDTANHVFRFVNAGATAADWLDITGNLNPPMGSPNPPLSSDLRTIELFTPTSAAGDDVVLVGGLGGVFRTLNPEAGSAAVWTEFGVGMPNVVVRDLHYIPATPMGSPFPGDHLLAGTNGRSAWTVSNASASLPVAGGVLQINGDTDFAGEDDTIRLLRNANNPTILDVYLNSAVPTFSVQLSVLQQINVNGLGGNDTLIVDSTNGLINVPLGIRYGGGTGFNSLQLVQTDGTMQNSDSYTPGPNIGMGISTISGPSGTQTVFFQNLDPVIDLVPATNLNVSGTPSNNAISYTAGSLASRGLVSIDNLEPIEFANKINLFVNSGLGTDTFSLNDPNTPTGLSNITVTGGDPSANDSLTVTGVAPTVTVDTAGAVITGASGTSGAVPINYSGIGNLTVTAGSSTTLAVSGSHAFAYTPATAGDGGAIQTDTLPISFAGFGSGTTLALTGLGISTDSLTANGTTGNDTFTVAATTGNVTLAGRAIIAPTAIPNLILNGLEGGDIFNVTGPQPYTSITLAGGGALAGDIANVTGNGTNDVTARVGGVTASVTGGGLGSVSLPGVQTLNLNAGAANLTLKGTSGPDAFTVTPTGANTATAQVGSLAPVVNTTNTGNFTVDADGDSDTLTINGTSNADTINVSGTAVTVVGLKTVNYTNVESLQVNGLAGSDTFTVTSSAAVPISIDGGDPVGVVPGDVLNVVSTGSDHLAFNPGPTGDQGSILVNSDQPINFVHVESLEDLSGAAAAVINGTSGNDVIAIAARDGSYNAAADGVQDFTVSVNNGASFLFLNTPSLAVHAGAGDDQITLQAPAPNLAAWNVAVTADGGASSAVGDQLVVSATGTDQSTYTPASANSGALAVANSNGAVANVTITDIESFIYDGQAGGDGFTVAGSSGANAFTLTPGAANDAGVLSMDSTLPVTFQNLGAAGQVIFNGNGGVDSLVYNGTAANDGFIINSSALGGQVNLNSQVPLVTQSIPTLSLEGLAGDDTFTLVPTIGTNPYTTLNLDGGATASATGNQANLTAAAGAALTASGQVITQSGKKVAGTSLQNINLNGAGNDLTYNGIAGVTENINVIASPTANQGQLSIPNVALWSFTNVPIVFVNGQTADSDTLTFTGTNNDDVFQIHLEAAGTDAAPVLKLQDTLANTLLTLENYTGFQTLNIAGLDGSDVFNVHVAPTGPGRQIFINGDVPSGKKKGTDVLHVFYAKPKPKIVHTTSTQDHDAGLVSADYGAGLPFFLIQFDGIENVTIGQE